MSEWLAGHLKPTRLPLDFDLKTETFTQTAPPCLRLSQPITLTQTPDCIKKGCWPGGLPLSRPRQPSQTGGDPPDWPQNSDFKTETLTQTRATFGHLSQPLALSQTPIDDKTKQWAPWLEPNPL